MPLVRERLARIRAARDNLTTDEAQAAVRRLEDASGGVFPGREVAGAMLDLQSAIAAFEEDDIVLRDVDRGLVDFPALRDGEEIYLCWLADDEDEIAFWHDPDAGFAGRQRL